ncbi:MAG: helix-turn-helix transcriptional regulator, partial [Anaerolineaceae bacterium]|nr:helix-turn-helix transcriptional regulator [Anaerolineaceae bacterium]
METNRKQITGLDKEITKKIGRIIARIRQNKKVTQVELAEMLNLDQSLICSYENGTRRIPINQFVKIARALGVSPGKLLDEAESSNGKIPSIHISRRFLKRVEEMEQLPEPDKKAIVRTIDALLLQYKVKNNIDDQDKLLEVLGI